jgi:hypothetical protein
MLVLIASFSGFTLAWASLNFSRNVGIGVELYVIVRRKFDTTTRVIFFGAEVELNRSSTSRCNNSS